MKRRSTPPVASTLLEAMRAIGYSFETAVADLVDNSITAHAGMVELSFSPFDEPFISVRDDGHGMTPGELFEAMRHGSKSPLAVRAVRDLGRFGLGLKTASLSQCRRLTVVSKQAEVICGAEWNLDEVIAADGDWALLELENDDVMTVPGVDRLMATSRGTLVVWRCLDRALAGESDSVKALQDHVDRTRAHLALVFHRYMEGPSPALTIFINGMKVVPVDPFLRSRKGRQSLPPELLVIDDQRVLVEAHILPHVSKLTPQEIAEAGGEEGLRRNQGFYVYRNRRLIVWGTWFRLVKQEEMTKLARVIVDIPNSLDHLWSLDIKKSAAHPPEQVRQGLRRIVDRIAERSRRVYTFRGNASRTSDVVRGWQRLELRNGRFRYKLNREHDLFNALRQVVPEAELPLLERFIQMVEESFPYESVYTDMAAEKVPALADHEEEVEERLRDTAMRLLQAFAGIPGARQATLERLHLLEPFCRHAEVTRKLQEELA